MTEEYTVGQTLACRTVGGPRITTGRAEVLRVTPGGALVCRITPESVLEYDYDTGVFRAVPLPEGRWVPEVMTFRRRRENAYSRRRMVWGTPADHWRVWVLTGERS